MTPTIAQTTSRPPSPFGQVFHSWWRNIVFLLIINIACLVGIVFLGSKTRQTALELQKAREAKIQLDFQSQSVVVQDTLERYKGDAEKLNALFLGDDGVFGFIGQMDELKTSGVISDFSIVSDTIEKDSLGFSGLPVSIILSGTQDQLNSSLQRIYQLDVLINPIYLEITKGDENIYEYKLGGFLYVNEEFN